MERFTDLPHTLAPPVARRRMGGAAVFLLAVLFLALGWFYIAAADAHASKVNWFKARGDQSWVLGAAERIYHNRHDDAPPQMLPRTIMPLYPAYLSLFYTPALSDDAFFEVAKKWNVRLSVALLIVLGFVFARHLPRLVATNLTLVVAFGYFIFKAGYAQPELLFYFLLFMAFLAGCYALREEDSGRGLILAAAAGVLAALAHLTVAAMLPVVAVWTVAWLWGEGVRIRRAGRSGVDAAASLSLAGWRALAVGVFLSCFFLTLLPYTVTSKRVFGAYFYNADTTFAMWYDSQADEIKGARAHGDATGWPDLPPEQLPSASKYFATHSIGQIAARVGRGVLDIVQRSYEGYAYLKYVAIYLAFGAVLIGSNRREFMELVRSEPSVAAFVTLYFVVMLLDAAFYHPISGTGTARYVIAHLTPLLFALAFFSTLPPFRDTVWDVAGVPVTTTHVNMAITVVLAADIAFAIWPRLMTTYGGF